MKLDFKSHFSQDSQDFDKIVVDGQHRWCDSEPEVDTLGIYIENKDWNRECLSLMQLTIGILFKRDHTVVA